MTLGKWIWLLLILAPYGVAAPVVAVRSVIRLLHQRSKENLQFSITACLLSAPLPLIIVLLRHDAYITCVENLDMWEYRQSRYSAESMGGAFDTYNCVKYRVNKDLNWRVDGEPEW